MPLIVADRVWETTSTSGTGTLTLSGAVSGYQTFAAIGNGNTTYYTITNGTDFEVGIGTYTVSGTTLSRDTVLTSSLGGTTKINVTPGSFVFVDYPAEKAVYEDASNNVTGYSISGGTIDNTTIGATTPSTVNATTLSGQTGVLRGTGQNLYVFSEQFDNGNWDKFSVTVTANSTTAPDGTTTADTLIGNGLSSNHRADQTTRNSAPVGTPKVISVYAKANTNNFIQLFFNGDVVPFANFDLNAGTVGTVGSTTTASIVSAGNGWHRCVAATTSTTAANPGICLIASSTDSRVPTNSLSTSVFLWGCQVEVSNTAGTYIPTTTTAVYGTPTLSFSGVSTIGLQSNGALFLQPAGTGAIQAQQATSTTAGGNVRGANAVDWQTLRASAAQVASGARAVLVGGDSNTSSGSFTSVVGGLSNAVSGTVGFIGGGRNNTVLGNRASIVGGDTNNANGFYNFIGGGFTNSGTASAAVTTQATTAVTSGSTAVTLSGSNANIRVGQLITGTGINSDTYVAAISGTSLTLSTNATATGTPTLSFFTPHGVVVGGGNNQATGSYTFIGGGGDAGTAANRNVASGDFSVVVGGINNRATGTGAVVVGGGTDGIISGNLASGILSTVVGGRSNTASGNYSFVNGAVANTASGSSSSTFGGSYATTRAIVGNSVTAASETPLGTFVTGNSQSAILVLAKQTTDATPTALCSNSSAAGTTNQVILPNNSAYYFRGEIVSGVTGGGATKGFSIEGVIKRGANAASTALVGTPTVTSSYADAGAAAFAIAVTADTTNGGLRVTFTGVAATTIRTVCQIRTTEMTF